MVAPDPQTIRGYDRRPTGLQGATTLDDSILNKLREMSAERDELDRMLCDPSIVVDHARVRDLSIRKSALDPVADAYRRAERLAAEAADLREMLERGSDAELLEMAEAELPGVESERERVLRGAIEQLVNADDRAIGSVMLEIRAGVGGDEAGLWSNDLLTMYQRFAAIRGWKFEPVSLDYDEGLGGLRSGVVSVRGAGVWSELAQEAGTHCVKRVPATEAQGRVHTSTATVAVLPEPKDVEVTIDPDDVDEHITTAQGPGGQNVNKVATAVHLVHRPTGIEVRMQETKSQTQNREKAWRLLRARIYELELRRQREREAAARSEQIGSGGRAERIRTYRYKDNIAVDHRLNESFDLSATLRGEIEPIVGALIEHETARRIAAL